MNQKLRTFFTVIFFVGSIIAICGILFLVVKEKKRDRVIEDEIAALQAEKKRIEQENSALEDRIAYLHSEHSYEKEAKKLNYKNPGEQVVIIRREHRKEEQQSAEISETQEQEQKKPHYQIWFEYFF